ncbi:MAG: BamA/TamA family outer membrane protein [Kofleriaceae bacterium]
MCRWWLCLVIAVIASRPAEAGERPIAGFRVRGDSKLTERTLAYLARIELGQLIDETDIPQLTQALVSSELFETVTVTLEDTPEGVLVVATLDDKHSWIVAPTLYLLPGKRAVGVGYAENNLAGRNEKLLLYGQYGNRESLVFGTYLDPSVRGTRLTWRFDLYGYHRVNDEYANRPDAPTSDEILRTSTATFLGAGALLGRNLAWWLVGDLRFRGAYVFYTRTRSPERDLRAPQTDGWDVTVQARLTLDRRGHRFGVTWGPYVQLMLESTVPGLDDFGYQMGLLRAYYSWRLFEAHQLELRTNLQVGRHLPFHEELTLGGVADLRGYEIDRFRGDRRALVRAEYSVPLAQWNWLALRGIGFWDAGYMAYRNRRPGGDRDYLETQRDGASWFRNDVGAGLRVYLKSIVLPLLGLDIAYGIESRKPQVYFELGLTDF